MRHPYDRQRDNLILGAIIIAGVLLYQAAKWCWHWLSEAISR